MRWTYYIEGHQVFPMNTRGYEIKNNLDDSIIHAYRRLTPDSLVLVGDDYEYIKSLESQFRFNKFSLQVHDNGTLHVGGEFTINDCSFDDYKSNCTVKITPRDIYTQIQEVEDIEVNIVADREGITIERYSRWYFFVTKTTGTVSSDYGPNKFIFSAPASLFGIYVNLFVTELITVDKDAAIPSGFDVTPFSDLGDFIIYQRLPDNFPTLNYVIDGLSGVDTSDYQWSAMLLYHKPFDETIFNLIKVGPSFAGVTTDVTLFWLRKSLYNGRANLVFDQSYSGMDLKDSLTRILSTACPDFTGEIKSSLLFEDVPETGKSLPSGYPQSLTSKYLIEMSDFRKPNASQEATKGIITWKKAIEYLCQKFNARWTIDSDVNLRIEHISYFDNTETGLDISSSDVTRKYAYLSNDKPNREYLSESSGWNEDFEKIEVLYGTVPALNGIKENTKSISLSTIYTDIDGLNSHVSELANDGFVLVEAVLWAVTKGTGFKSGESNLQNVGLSNANCLNTYYRHNAYQDEYQIGGIDVTALTLKKQKVQEIVFTSSSIPDVTKFIQTRIGSGVVTSLSYKPTEEYNFKATLIYG